jgi:hypothetical protein
MIYFGCVISNMIHVQIVTVESAVDLGSGYQWKEAHTLIQTLVTFVTFSREFYGRL